LQHTAVLILAVIRELQASPLMGVLEEEVLRAPLPASNIRLRCHILFSLLTNLAGREELHNSWGLNRTSEQEDCIMAHL